MWRRSVLVSLVIQCCVWALVESYPLGDLTLDGLLGAREAVTVSHRRRQIDSTSANGCLYAGTVALTSAGRVLYTGIYYSGTVRVPTDALLLLQLSNSLSPLTVYGDDGTSTATIAAGALPGAAVRNTDGTSTITLTTDFTTGVCPSTRKDAIFYDFSTMNIDVSTCQVVAYGGRQTNLHTYDGILTTDPLEHNNVEGCCADVMPNILSKTPNLGNPDARLAANLYTCVKTGEGICNGDIGAPIYCEDRRSGGQVVVGMVDSGTCDRGEYVAVIDFTTGTLPGFSS